jgi:hypothetical protein
MIITKTTVPSTYFTTSNASLLSRVSLVPKHNHVVRSCQAMPMDSAPVVKRRRTSDCSITGASLIESSPLPDHWKAFPWNKFPGFTVSERAGRQTSWVWQHGFDIQACDSPNRRKWVCRPCLQMPKPKRTDFSALGTQNIEKHLYREHRLVDESGKRLPALAKRLKEKTPSLNIVKEYYYSHRYESLFAQICVSLLTHLPHPGHH